jgi:hypothetical protein
MSIRTPGTVEDQVLVTSAVSGNPDASAAVAELARSLGDTAALFVVLVAPGYDLDAVATAVDGWCGDRVIGCTSSGNIGPHEYERTGICAIALSGGGLRTRTIRVDALADTSVEADQAGVDLSAMHGMWAGSDGFAILLVDGLNKREDRLVATLMATLGDVPIIGGSAGDDLTFSRTAVLCDGRFVDDGATLTMVTLDAPFQLFRLQHHEASDVILVATDAAPDLRPAPPSPPGSPRSDRPDQDDEVWDWITDVNVSACTASARW